MLTRDLLAPTGPTPSPHPHFGKYDALIADLAARPRRPTFGCVRDTAKAHSTCRNQRDRHDGAAALQAAAGAIQTYVNRFWLDDPWRFAGNDFALEPNGSELLWSSSSGRVLIDITYTGRAFLLGASENQLHVSTLTARHHEVHGEAFIGARLLTLTEPRQSLLVAPTGATTPLETSDIS